MLFKTQNSSRRWRIENFIEDFVYASQEAARYLADCGVRTVGFDYLSVDGFWKDGAGIWIIEGLYLSGVEPDEYELICLPLKVEDGDVAPARAIVRK